MKLQRFYSWDKRQSSGFGSFGATVFDNAILELAATNCYSVEAPGEKNTTLNAAIPATLASF